jgi:acyl-CoA synthetase (NDP forming)/GNAT superfamily N-acetyltransferase
MVAVGIDVVRADGGLVHIRPVRDGDRDALLALNDRVSDTSIYYRFFSLSRHTADIYLDRLLRPPDSEHESIVALVGGKLVGVAAFERVTATSAEIALLIDDHDQHEGIGTILIEHLASIAGHGGVRQFVADVLAQNTAVLGMIRDLGFVVSRKPEHEIVRLSFDIDATPEVIAAVDARERQAATASLRLLLAPGSVAVIGAGARPRSVGHEVLRNILDGGFTGAVYVVNPKHDAVLGVPSVASPLDLPVAPDLAVVAVPAADVLEVVRACGVRGARGVLLVAAGFGESGDAGEVLQHEVLAAARGHGMRLIGPNCLGLVNTDPAVRLNATFASLSTEPGAFGLVSQSGALGIAVLAAAQRCGLGVAQFVSVGNKADVSSNDLLLAWEADERISVIGLYLESFGNPRKSARIARRVSRTKPIIAIKSGRSAAGKRAGRSHTAAAASSDSVVDALFVQSGVLRVDRMEQMLDMARLLTGQPVPAGPRIAIVGNSGGPGVLAADAADAAGLVVVELDDATERLIGQAVPSAASCRNPVDLGAAAQPGEAGAAVRILLDAHEVDAVLTVFTEASAADPDEIMAAVVTATLASAKPVAATQVGGQARSVSVPGTSRVVPVFAFPEPAATAMGFAYRYARIQSAPPGEPARLESMDVEGARAVVADRLATGAGWLDPDAAAGLLVRYGISLCPQRVVADADAAVRAAADFGYPVAAKLAGGVVRKTDVGGVRLGLGDEKNLREAFAAVQAAGSGSKVLIQPMLSAGTELIAGAVQDAQFGPVIMLGAGGVLADMIVDRQFRLAPLSVQDADEMIATLRTAPLLDGYRGRTPVSRAAIRTLLLRLAALVDDLPEVAELDLNPVICSGEELIVVDAKIRIAPAHRTPDPLLRGLRD